MPNRSMQVKHERAARERAAIAIDIAQRTSYRPVIAEVELSLADIIASYDGPITRIVKTARPRQISESTKICTAAYRRQHAIARRTA